MPKNAEKCHVNGLPGMKVPGVNSVCEGMGEMNSTRTRRLLSQDENTHAKQKFYHPAMKFILR